MPTKKTVSIENDVASATTTLTDKMPALPLDGPQGRRAIGPRVTFHFISEPWSSDNSYEAYDIVQVGGASYVALRSVPTGIQLENNMYWFKWAEPNAQFAQLQDTVETFDGRIKQNANDLAELEDNLDQSEMVLIGDSYMYESSYGSWVPYLAESLGLTRHNYALPGAGFVYTNPATGKNFMSEVEDAVSEITNKEKVKYVIVYGGINDVMNNVDKNTWLLNVQSVLHKLSISFPKSKIHFFANMFTANASDIKILSWMPFMQTAMEAISVSTTTRNVACHRDSAWWVRAFGLAEDDGVHPTASGRTLVCGMMVSTLNGGSDRAFSTTQFKPQEDSGITISNTYMGIDGDEIRLFNQFTIPQEYVTSTEITIGTFTNKWLSFKAIAMFTIVGKGHYICLLQCVNGTLKAVLSTEIVTAVNNSCIINAATITRIY